MKEVSDPLRSHWSTTSTGTEALSSIDWLSYLEIRNVAKVLKQRNEHLQSEQTFFALLSEEKLLKDKQNIH